MSKLRLIKLISFAVLSITCFSTHAQNYNMSSGTVQTCTGNFFDNGGSGANYSNNQNSIQTFCSSTTGTALQLNFTNFNIENGFDLLFIYNGSSTAAPLIGTYTGTNSPGTVIANSGCITLRFTSDAVNNASGWAAMITCIAPNQVACTSLCNGASPPVNDDCFGAQNLGTLPTPSPCPNGNSVASVINTTNICATPSSPYSSLQGCQPSGNQSGQASDVWYRFIVNAPILNVNLSGSLNQPNVALYFGTSCNSLNPIGCAIGNPGSLTASFNGLAAGTYYLQISGANINDQCDFSLSLQNNLDCAGCVIQSSLVATPPPINGNFYPGQAVDFCLTLSNYSQTSSNWLHGVVPSFGPGWDLSSLTVLNLTNCSGAGTWNWYNTNITSTATGQTTGPGFYYESSLGSPNGQTDNNPGNNYGDNNPNNICDWTFCWRILTDSNCIDGVNLNVSVNTLGDGESGSWTSLACINDPVARLMAGLDCETVYGFVYNDLNQNCIKDNNEPFIPNLDLLIDPGNIVVNSSSGGTWIADGLLDGNYTITIDTIQTQWIPHCDTTIGFSVISGEAGPISFGMTPSLPCTEPQLSVTMNLFRRCTNSTLFVNACNDITASASIQNSFVIIELDPFLTYVSSSITAIPLGGNRFRFNLGDLLPSMCTNFEVIVNVSCSTAIGQSLCVEGNLFPVEDCVLDTVPGPGNCNLPWDRSSLSVVGNCVNDSLACFTITNSGDPGQGDMQCYSKIRVYYDGLLTIVDSIQLAGGTDTTLCYIATGQTIRLEVDQHPLHPGNSRPNDVLELCGNNSFFVPGYVNAQYHDDADPVVDVFCGLVSAPYDPNDKTGFPTGLTTNHYVLPNQQMDYMIRFQNTGNDTAFTVIIRDTLDPNLNIFTVTPLSASHPYTFRMHGPRVLEWRFDYIMLPDSGTDFEGSQGFVRFNVEQNPNLPNGTQFFNEAYIYFDYNDPILTNQTFHTIQQPGAPPVALPVEWLDVFAKPESPTIVVHWSTITESNNRGFELLRLDENGQFVRIGWVDGNGNSNELKTYSFIDDNVDPNITYYYRLRQLDFNGRSDLSRIVSAKLDVKHFMAIAKPNPFTEQTEIALLLNESSMVKIEVFSALGQLVTVLHDGPLNSGTHRFPFNSNNKESRSNLYTVRLTVDGETDHIKLVDLD